MHGVQYSFPNTPAGSTANGTTPGDPLDYPNCLAGIAGFHIPGAVMGMDDDRKRGDGHGELDSQTLDFWAMDEFDTISGAG